MLIERPVEKEMTAPMNMIGKMSTFAGRFHFLPFFFIRLILFFHFSGFGSGMSAGAPKNIAPLGISTLRANLKS